MMVGDFVKGLPGSPYNVTNEKMTRGLVREVDGECIRVTIVEHENDERGTHIVVAKHFEVTGHAKPFNREEVLELLKNGCKRAILDYDLRGADLYEANLRGADLRGADLYEANLRGADLRGADLREANLREADLRGADLRGADLRGADLDFSCYPLWCGSLRIKTGEDIRLAAQLAYHLCSMQCDDSEYIKMRNSILDFANKFHRARECGVLEPIDTEVDADA